MKELVHQPSQRVPSVALLIVWDCDLTLSPPIRFLAAAAARSAKWVSTENRTNGGQRMRKEGGRADADGRRHEGAGGRGGGRQTKGKVASQLPTWTLARTRRRTNREAQTDGKAW